MNVPLPPDFCSWVWLGIGFTFARAFGKKLDQDIQNSEWFKRRRKEERWILKRLLDFLHHWWIGALMMCYFTGEPYWFGVGLFLDDLPDVPRRIKGYFAFP